MWLSSCGSCSCGSLVATVVAVVVVAVYLWQSSCGSCGSYSCVGMTREYLRTCILWYFASVHRGRCYWCCFNRRAFGVTCFYATTLVCYRCWVQVVSGICLSLYVSNHLCSHAGSARLFERAFVRPDVWYNAPCIRCFVRYRRFESRVNSVLRI